jgi:predicted ATPase
MCVLHAHWSRAEACQGYAQQAREHVRTGVQMARWLKHLPTLAITISSVCATDWVLRDKRALEARSSELVQLASEQGYESWLSRAKGYVGWIAAVNGRLEEGRYLLAERLAEMRRSGVFLYEPDTRAMLADVHARMGQPDLALAVLDEALAICARTGEVWVEAELHRQKGELLRCDRAAAEACFVMAIDTARRQSAKLYELRSAIGLARLWTAHGQHEEAHALLAPVYAWFTEGFDTPDLTEARELLDELTEPQQREPCCGAVAGTGRFGSN